MPAPDRAGRIDVGVIDLRDHLMPHRLVLRAGEGVAPGPVRMALCFGPPPVGPGGERQTLFGPFSPNALPSELIVD